MTHEYIYADQLRPHPGNWDFNDDVTGISFENPSGLWETEFKFEDNPDGSKGHKKLIEMPFIFRTEFSLVIKCDKKDKVVKDEHRLPVVY